MLDVRVLGIVRRDTGRKDFLEEVSSSIVVSYIVVYVEDRVFEQYSVIGSKTPMNSEGEEK